ncbi:MAG TPA: protein-L-isoaspartate(D-aspartate) O-methyltransferase [Rhizobiaceae bacterium]|nr:protein-L-isoaspartate(D-aspartate) O-methyltransferase [Rhizobiaceae bacterium]
MNLAKARKAMVDRQIAGRGITDAAVLEAMRKVRREDFVPPSVRELAYEDSPLPIGSGQTISQPYIVALMIEAAALKPGDTALEIGAGSGYAAALMGEIAAKIFTVERHAELAQTARERLAALGYANVEVRTGDGTLGLPDEAPFDAIISAAGGPDIPASWKSQLAIGGRLIMPVGGSAIQQLVKLVRTAEDQFKEESLGEVRFVRLIGEQGWKAA